MSTQPELALRRRRRPWIAFLWLFGSALLGDLPEAPGQVELPPGRRLVGFSRDHLYLSRTDELDFQWLERYAEPTVTGPGR